MYFYQNAHKALARTILKIVSKYDTLAKTLLRHQPRQNSGTVTKTQSNNKQFKGEV